MDECVICHKRPDSPAMVLPCLHNFCWACLQSWRDASLSDCVCGAKVQQISSDIPISVQSPRFGPIPYPYADNHAITKSKPSASTGSLQSSAAGSNDSVSDSTPSASVVASSHESQTAAKRARTETSHRPAEAKLSLDPPLRLLRVRDLPAWANEGLMFCSLRDLVEPGLLYALASNYMVDFPWMMSAFPALAACPRFVLVHGEREGSVREAIERGGDMLRKTGVRFTHHTPWLPPYGTHHSKFFILQYARGLRVVVHTANYVYSDCNNKTQGVFSQDFPRCAAPSTDGCTDALPRASGFGSDLLAYLCKALSDDCYAEVAGIFALHDFSAARAALVASTPHVHTGDGLTRFGHMRLRALLDREQFPERFAGARSQLVCQYSSVGSLHEKWIDEFRLSLQAGRCVAGDELSSSSASSSSSGTPRHITSFFAPSAASDGAAPPKRRPLGPAESLTLVWPTVSEVQNSIEGWFAGRSIPGPPQNVRKDFLMSRYARFGGEPVGRQRAMPHIKTYTRFDPKSGEMAWFLLTSANLSKAAWGALQRSSGSGEMQLAIKHFELGCLLLPRLELAYRSSPHFGFRCTGPSCLDAGAPSTGSAASVFGLEAPLSSSSESTGSGAPLSSSSAPTGSSPSLASEARFVPWRRGMPDTATVAGGTLTVPLPVPYALPPTRYQPPRAPAAANAGGESTDYERTPWDVGTAFEGVDALGLRMASARSRSHYGVSEDSAAAWRAAIELA